jgi:TRAP-type C4-dicarboxylate transport system permease small subunit
MASFRESRERELVHSADAGARVIVEGVALFGLAVMVLTALIGVLDRFVIGSGQPWPEELARFTLIWTSLIAAAVAAKHSQHYRLSFFYDRFGRKGAAIIDVLCIAALGVVCWQGIALVRIFNNQISPALGLPMSYVYAAVPVSSALIIWYLLRNLVARWRSPRTEQPVIGTRSPG